jgi:chorismate mutase
VHHMPVEDLAQEARVLDAVEGKARALGLEPAGVRGLFELEIALAKRIETTTSRSDAPLDLESELRPALARLSDRQLEALARAAPLSDAGFDAGALAPLGPVLEPAEIGQLRSALQGVRPAR